MRWSLITSLALHVAILVATFIVMPNPAEFKVQDQEMIPVDIVSVEDFSKRMAMTKAPEAPKKVEKPKPKPQEVKKDTKPAPKEAPEVKTAAKEPKKEEPPPPEPKKEEPKKVEPKKAEEPKPEDPLKDLIKETVDDTPLPKKEEPKKKEETKQAEAKPEKKPEKKVEKKKPEKKLDVSEIENFLNKIDDEKAAPQKPAEETGQPQQAEANLSGTDQQLAATLIDLLRQRLSQCWSAPAGAREAQIVVKVKFQLDQQGNVVGLPQVLSAGSDTLSQTTAQSAVSAIMECQTYEFLPADKYDLWKEITINFNPNMMS
jgi:colicin import membrane protein